MRILLSAAEPSGDAIGAELMDGFRRIGHGPVVAGAAGPRMVGSGVLALADGFRFAHAGWASVVSRLPWLAWGAWRYFRAVDLFQPDKALFVDAPGLHGPLSRRLRRKGIPVGWVAPPQLWAWKNRSSSLLRGMRVYPSHAFEIEPLVRAGASVQWWGYPGPRPPRPPLDAPRDRLAILPGSRAAWRRRHLDLFGEAALRADLGLELVLVHPRPPGPVENGFPCVAPTTAFARAALAISLPGTATLEAGLWGVPTLVAASPGPFDLWMARRHLSEGFRALPNRILGAPVFPEIYGSEATVEVLASSLTELYGRREEVSTILGGLRDRLGSGDAAFSIARHFLET